MKQRSFPINHDENSDLGLIYIQARTMNMNQAKENEYNAFQNKTFMVMFLYLKIHTSNFKRPMSANAQSMYNRGNTIVRFRAEQSNQYISLIFIVKRNQV